MGKKRNPVFYFAIGCVGLLVVAGVVAAIGLYIIGSKAKELVDSPVTATARAFALANPDVDFVSADEDAGKATFRLVNDGDKEVTVDFEDIKQGKVSFTSSDGEEVTFGFEEATAEAGGGTFSVTQTGEDGEEKTVATFGSGGDGDGGDLPGWVPAYEGATFVQQFSSNDGKQELAMYQITPGDDLKAVADWYETTLRDQGYDVTRNDMTSGGQRVIIMGGTKDVEGSDVDRSVNLTLGTDDQGETTGALQYGGPAGN
ncbi:MAG: hypothetical protein AAGD01_03395 [Acidobacteriota bacterium]